MARYNTARQRGRCHPTRNDGKQAGTALATMGWSAVFAKKSVLYGQMPGAHFQVYFEGSLLHIKIGKRESLFTIVSAGE